MTTADTNPSPGLAGRSSAATPAQPVHAAGPGSPDDRGVTRRSLLRRGGLAAGTALVVSAGGLGYRAYDEGVFQTGEGGAYDAWSDWNQHRGPMALVAAAILAANAHNAQAWVFHVSPQRIELFADGSRNLGAVDPLRREMYVGLGAALENLMQSAAANGYRAILRLLPSPGRPLHAATVELSPGPTLRSALHEQIPHRHTDRTAYTAQAVAPGDLQQMAALGADLPGPRVYWFTSSADRDRLGALMIAAAQALTDDHQQSVDDNRWFRHDWDAIQRFKDGLTIDAQGLPALTAAIAKMLPATSRQYNDTFWVKRTRDPQVRTAAAYGILAVPDPHSNAQRLTGGRLLQRIHLWTAAHGLSLGHMNQITERADRERQLGLPPRFGDASRGLIPDAGFQQLVAFRVGHPSGTDGRRPSPRRPAPESPPPGGGGHRMSRTAAVIPPVQSVRHAKMDRAAGRLAALGATLGMIAGAIDIAAGASIREWIGNKLHPAPLGLATVMLSAVALVGAAAWQRPGGREGDRRLASILAFLLPAGICFTTIGRLWYLPGLLLLGAALLVTGASTREQLSHAVNRDHWRRGLVTLLGGYDLFLGGDTLPKPIGVLGILGGLAIWGALIVTRRSHRLAALLLVAGALPFAIATWWSVVTPLIAVLVLTLGAVAIRSEGAGSRAGRSRAQAGGGREPAGVL